LFKFFGKFSLEFGEDLEYYGYKDKAFLNMMIKYSMKKVGFYYG